MSTLEPANVLLCSIEDNVASRLQDMLGAFGDQVSRNPHALRNADLVFCGTEPESLQRLLQAVKRTGRDVPVIVVSPDPGVDAWLDALEAGAADYLPAPFDPT